MIKRRLISWRPVGGVCCPRCNKNKNSGGYYKIESYNNHEIEKKLMCDNCKVKFEKWYKQRENEHGFVIIK